MSIEFKENISNNKLTIITEYATHLTGVTDDFWEQHVFDSKIYDIFMDDKAIGYFSVFEDEKLTMFYVKPSKIHFSQDIFKQILSQYHIKTAFVATCDELFLSICLDNHKSIEMQAYFFDGTIQNKVRKPEYNRECITQILPSELDDVNKETKGFFDFVKEEKLINNQMSIYRLSKDNNNLGYGIIVRMRSHTDLWVCGMITIEKYRQKGVGRSILIHLDDICRENKKTPVAGCWYYNHFSKKTIESSGKYSNTRLLNIHF